MFGCKRRQLKKTTSRSCFFTYSATPPMIQMRVAKASQAIVQAIEVYRPLLQGMSNLVIRASLFCLTNADGYSVRINSQLSEPATYAISAPALKSFISDSDRRFRRSLKVVASWWGNCRCGERASAMLRQRRQYRASACR